MNSIHTNLALDFKTLTAVLALGGEESLSILGAWNSMETLAREDPDGCVRLTPGLPMDIAALAGFLRCPEALVEKTVSVFAKLRRLTVKDGLIRLLACGGEHCSAPASSVTEEALARKREQCRIRQARSRARKKLDMEANRNTNADANENRDADTNRNAGIVVNETITNIPNHDRYNGERDNRDSRCVTNRDTRDSRCDQRDIAVQSRTATAVTPMRDRCDTVRDRRDNTAIYNRNVNTIHPLHSLQAHKPVSQYDHLIPLNELSEEEQNVIDTWNRLPLPKYKGLYPDLRDKLNNLMKQYGEDTLCKTIAGIADNAFLLGKKFGKTWSVSLGWLLDPEHFANVLAGKYREGKYDSGCGNAWHPGERLPFYLPGEGETRFTPEEQEQAIRDLYIPTTPAQLKAARLVGLPGFREETA